MCNIPPLGAYIKGTNEYIYPKIATKENKYECPSCRDELIIKKGSVRIHHFAHCRSDDPCNYYSRPSESDMHKDAKILLKILLERKTKIFIKRKCCGEYEIPIISKTAKINLEHRFEYNGLKIADVAYIDESAHDDPVWGKINNIRYIFEICHTHKTDKDKRPEPWFEIKASKLLKLANSNTDTLIIPCMRKDKCLWCLRKDKLKKLEPSRRIYVDVPYSDREEAKRMGMCFDFDGHRKWMMWNTNRNKDKILSKYKELKYDENININDKYESKFIRELIKPENKNNLDMFVRMKLGQKTFFPTPKMCQFTDLDDVNTDKYNYCYNGQHDFFHFDAQYDHDKIRKNKDMINLFNDYLFDKRCVIYTQKHYVCIYIVKSDDYDKYDYYGFDYFKERKKLSGDYIPYPYLYCSEYSIENTLIIIKHLLKICAYIFDILRNGLQIPDYIDIPRYSFGS